MLAGKMKYSVTPEKQPIKFVFNPAKAQQISSVTLVLTSVEV